MNDLWSFIDISNSDCQGNEFIDNKIKISYVPRSQSTFPDFNVQQYVVVFEVMVFSKLEYVKTSVWLILLNINLNYLYPNKKNHTKLSFFENGSYYF